MIPEKRRPRGRFERRNAGRARPAPVLVVWKGETGVRDFAAESGLPCGAHVAMAVWGSSAESWPGSPKRAGHIRDIHDDMATSPRRARAFACLRANPPA
jgi:hypothetical protein